MYTPSGAASYFEASGGAQVTVAGSSPPAVPSHSMVGITMDVGGSPIVSGAGAYLIHGGMDSARHSLAHTSRSSPATVGTGPRADVSSGRPQSPAGTSGPGRREQGKVAPGSREPKPRALAVPSRSPRSPSPASCRRGSVRARGDRPRSELPSPCSRFFALTRGEADLGGAPRPRVLARVQIRGTAAVDRTGWPPRPKLAGVRSGSRQPLTLPPSLRVRLPRISR